jgi:hypothetical protein
LDIANYWRPRSSWKMSTISEDNSTDTGPAPKSSVGKGKGKAKGTVEGDWKEKMEWDLPK